MGYQFAGKVFRFFKKRFSCFEYIFECIGLVLGVVVPILLLVAGIASIPFTAGGSVPILWLGYLCFAASIYVMFVNAARAWGIMLDAISEMANGLNPNNEKLATMMGFIVGITLAFIAVALNFAPIPFVSSLIHIALWKGALLIFPWIVGLTAGCARVCGRLVDHFQPTINKITLLTLLKKWLFAEPKQNELNQWQELKPVCICKAITGIEKYFRLREEKNHDDMDLLSKCFDRDAGKKRAAMYLNLLMHKDMSTDFQKIIVLYTLLGSGQGKQLKKMVSDEMGVNVDAARKLFHDQIRCRIQDKIDRELLKENVINKLGLFADKGKSLYQKNGTGMKKDYRNIMKYLQEYAKPEYQNREQYETRLVI